MLITDSLDFQSPTFYMRKRKKQNPTNKFSKYIKPVTNALHILHTFLDYKTRG